MEKREYRSGEGIKKCGGGGVVGENRRDCSFLSKCLVGSGKMDG